MKSARAAAAILVFALATSSCGSRGDTPLEGAAPPAAIGPLPEGVVARVGAGAIHAESIGRIAALQHVDVRAARDLAVRDALFAGGAEARGLDVAAEVRGVLARRLLRAIRAEVEQIPLTAEELTEAAEAREQYSHVPRAPRARGQRGRHLRRPLARGHERPPRREASRELAIQGPRRPPRAGAHRPMSGSRQPVVIPPPPPPALRPRRTAPRAIKRRRRSPRSSSGSSRPPRAPRPPPSSTSEGETVDYTGNLDTFDIKIAAAHWQIVIAETADTPAIGAIRQMTLRARGRGYVVRRVQENYAVLLILHRRAAFTVSGARL